LLFLKNRNLSWKDYNNVTSQFGAKFVSKVDQNPLLSYLDGKVDTVAGLEAVARIVVPEKELVDEGEAKPTAAKSIWTEIPKDPAELLGTVREVERNLVHHTSVLMCPVQTFDPYTKVASDYIKKFKKEEERGKKEAGSRDPPKARAKGYEKRPAEVPTVSGRVKINPQTGQASTKDVRMEFDEEQYRKNRFGDAKFDVNEYGGAPMQVDAESVIPPESEAEMAAVRKQEEKEKERARRKEEYIRKKKEEKRRQHAEEERQRKKESRERPIVLISPGYNCILNKYNVKTFLEKGNFEPWDVANKKNKGKPKSTQNMTRVFNRTGSDHVSYKITEEVPQDPNQWKRVCAVLVTGKKWQFKGYPANQFKGLKENNFSSLFTSLCGFYFHYTSDPVPKEVTEWNVKVIGIDKNNRHKDIAAFREFWTNLDRFLAEKKRRGDFNYKY